MIVIPCKYDGPDHEFPDDWIFGGANGQHPGADPRWHPTIYVYYNDRAQPIWSTVTPLCDDQAIDEFTLIARHHGNPVWLSAERTQEDGTKVVEMLPWTYDKSTDTATEKV